MLSFSALRDLILIFIFNHHRFCIKWQVVFWLIIRYGTDLFWKDEDLQGDVVSLQEGRHEIRSLKSIEIGLTKAQNSSQ